ncbi:MAG TPA: PE-PPE domain-containing protein [Mycobacterium sp.]|nr:PE-PPE domain-containing protein [Mycobacterium sp.]
MSDQRWLRVMVLAGTAAAAMALASVLTAASALAEDTALIMGGSGNPIPSQSNLDSVNELYVHCDPPVCTPQPLFTPEGLYPFFGVKELPFDTSLSQGVTILNEAIKQQLADGSHVTVFGSSQSADIASVEMANIADGTAGIHPAGDQLSFVLSGDEMNPNGGALMRFDLPAGSEPSFPSFGITFLGATPVSEYPTEVYTGEYDGFADFPRYPLNLLSDVNALLGIVFVHIATPTPAELAQAVAVPTSAGYDGATGYEMIPTENLPLLDPVRSIPGFGPILADLVQPDLKVLVNLGYGDPDYGWVNENSDVPTPVGVFPSAADLDKVPALLATGAQEGIQKATADIEAAFGDPSQFFSLVGNPIATLLQNGLVGTAIGGNGGAGEGLTGFVNALSSAASQLYSTLLPTADTLNALFTSIPAYDASVFASELAHGNLLDAFGLPLAADAGLLTFLTGFEIAPVGEGLVNAVMDLLHA